MFKLSEDLDLSDSGDGKPFLFILQSHLLQGEQLSIPLKKNGGSVIQNKMAVQLLKKR